MVYACGRPEPVGQVVSAVAENIHPPLYFVLLHYWIQVPWPMSQSASMRAMSAVWAFRDCKEEMEWSWWTRTVYFLDR
jgi:hypothetical protein